jgi:GGDEF domain-containing protein
MATVRQRRQTDARPPLPAPFAPTPPVWGTPDPEAFLRSVAHALEAARAGRRPLTLVAMEVTAAPGTNAEAVLGRVAEIVRRTVRASDGLWRDGATTLGLLLADADGPRAEPALARIRLRLRGEREATVRMGRAVAAPGLDAGTLLEIACADRQLR